MMAERGPLRLGTRSSPLAQWQSKWIAARLKQLAVDTDLVHVTTQGDQHASQPIHSIGGQGVFTKAIQQALLDHHIDVAVHSLKDLPTEPIEGLQLAAVPERASASDALVSRDSLVLDDLPTGTRVGSGSLRRQAQLLFARPDLHVDALRGNVETRLRKLDEGQFDALVLAEAGLTRLQLEGRITQILPLSVMLPAVGQGALGLEARTDDSQTRSILEQLDHAQSHQAVLAERSMLSTLRGGCLAPVAALGKVDDDRLRLDGIVLSADGSQRISAFSVGDSDEAEIIGSRVAEQLIQQGAERLIGESRRSG